MPAANKIPAPNQRLVVSSMGDISLVDSKAHCRALATKLKSPHANRYPATNMLGGTLARPVSDSWDVTRMKMRIAGAALGSIMAIIMIHHMENMRAA